MSIQALPALHPGSMAGCTCTTGAEHRAVRQASYAAWDAAYNRITQPLCPGCHLNPTVGARYCAACRIS